MDRQALARRHNALQALLCALMVDSFASITHGRAFELAREWATAHHEMDELRAEHGEWDPRVRGLSHRCDDILDRAYQFFCDPDWRPDPSMEIR